MKRINLFVTPGDLDIDHLISCWLDFVQMRSGMPDA